MLDWASHYEVLYGLYVTEKKTLRETKAHMESIYSFHATTTQYHTQFKKWKFQKNLKKNDWVYVSQKLSQRGQRVSVVYHDGVLIPHDKVKKNISRHVHPNDVYKLGNPLPSPKNVVVRSPSPTSDSQALLPYTRTHTRRSPEISAQGFSSPKNQRLISLNGTRLQTILSTALSERSSWRNAFCALNDVDLNSLPYFQLRAMFDSEAAKTFFQDILTFDDPVSGKSILYHFWPDSSSPMPVQMLSDSPYATIDMEMEDDWKVVFQRLRPEPKPFGITFLQQGSLDVDDLVHQRCTTTMLTSFLANIPRKNDKEAQLLEELLLGPPTIEAARRFIEVGIYNVSNNLHYKYGLDPFIETLLQSISWAVLRPLLSLPVISIQAFTESVFLHAVTTQRLQVVEDLLRYDWIRATVVSNGLALVSAVRTSSCKLVSLMLRAGASPNKTALRDAVPLTEAKDIHVAKLLLEAGADINADHGRYSAPIRTSTIGPALLAATAARNIDLVRYLIEKGADVNSHGKLFSATMLAVQGGNIDILHLLLVSGALPNEAVHTTSSIRTPLQKAAELGDIQAVQLLIRFGANVNASAFGNSGKTALQAAVSRADVEMTELFLKNGADVNVLIKSDAKFPRSPLTVAVELNKPDLVKVILDAGADINILSYGYYGCTALESAMHLPDGSNVQNLLIARGAQHNAQFNNEHCQIQLRKAVWAADLARVKALLETGFKIDMQPFEDGPNDDYGRVREQIPRSILQDAIVAGTAMFQLLFEVIKGYDDDIDYHPILVEAIRAKKLEIQTTLLAAGAKVNSTHCHTGRMIGTPLMFAVWENDLESVRYLYHNGADINIVAEGFVLDIFGDASTALQISVWRSTQSLRQNCVSDILHFLRQHGATINAPIARNRGFSELARAAKAGMLTLVQELLDSGAKVNSLPAEIGGMTALQAAAGSHTARNDIVELLLQSGADVNAPTACQGGITALGAAAKQGHFQIALILLKAGADVNSEFIEYTRVPSTALIVAAREGRLDIVHLLLKAGADLHLPKEKRYIQAIEDAKRRGHIALATVLEGYCTVV